MEIVLLVVTVVSLVVALVMSVTAWRLARDEKQRSAARIAALSIAASAPISSAPGHSADSAAGQPGRAAVALKTPAPAPWARSPLSVEAQPRSVAAANVADMPLNAAPAPREVSHSSGFLGAAGQPARDSGGRQRSLAIAAVVLLVGLVGGLGWMMSDPRGTGAVALGPNSPLELVSLRHERVKEKLAVSGLVRNPPAGQPVERLSAVVFLFDRQGAFVTSARAGVDFLKIGAGDESPFVVSLEAPASVARYRVSFRTDAGIVPHIDRRGAPALATEGEQPVSVTLK